MNMMRLIKERPHPYTYIGIMSGRFNPLQVIRVVANEMNIEVDVMLSRTRKREAVYGRHIAAHIIKEFEPRMSLREVGFITGRRTHASVINSIEEVNNLLETDIRFCELYAKIREQIYHDPTAEPETVADEYMRQVRKRINNLRTNY